MILPGFKHGKSVYTSVGKVKAQPNYRVESEVEKWVYDKYQEAYYKTEKSHSNYIVITDEEFIAQLEKYSK